ncbi:MAG: hypothetical protein AAB393_15320, partial [Bacteroidota bacterium]
MMTVSSIVFEDVNFAPAEGSIETGTAIISLQNCRLQKKSRTFFLSGFFGGEYGRWIATSEWPSLPPA